MNLNKKSVNFQFSVSCHDYAVRSFTIPSLSSSLAEVSWNNLDENKLTVDRINSLALDQNY